jgi:3-phosphoshikimate 1-carboxyvinyltransferase
LRVRKRRISALVAGFRGLDIAADERPDGFIIHGAGAPTGGVADAQGDHRMAMAFAIAALAASGPSRIEGSDAVAISYPDFFETLPRLVA